MWVLNSEPNYPSILFQKKLYQNQKYLNNNIYDEEFVSLINALIDSIKEYYKVSINNITEANSFISFYEQQGKKIQLLIEEISNSDSYARINELFEQIPKINEIMAQVQMNTNSTQKKNLDLFFEDAKILFKKMKNKRKQNIIEIHNFLRNKDINNNFNNSLYNNYTFNHIKSVPKNLKMNKRKSEPKQIKRFNTITNITNNNISSLYSTSSIYSKIMILINNLNEFNYMLSKISLEASNKYNTLQNNIIKEFEILINLEKIIRI